MIFVTVGSQLPFDRFIAPVAAWARAQTTCDVYFQHGGTTVDLSGFEHAAFVTPDEAAKLFERAHIIVAHVGMGTILTCLELGKPIIVFPRKASLGETRNEHQSASARSLESRAGFFVAWDESELHALLERISTLSGGTRVSSDASPELIDAVRSFIHDA